SMPTRPSWRRAASSGRPVHTSPSTRGRGAMAVTYFVRMVAEEDQADRVLELLLSNPRRIEAGEPGNVGRLGGRDRHHRERGDGGHLRLPGWGRHRQCPAHGTGPR